MSQAGSSRNVGDDAEKIIAELTKINLSFAKIDTTPNKGKDRGKLN